MRARLTRAVGLVATAPIYAPVWLLGLLWKTLRLVGAVARQAFEDGSR